MKQIFFYLLTLLVPVFLRAQNTEGTINFTETVKMNIQIPDGPEGDEMRKMIPPTQSFESVLFFNEKASLYRPADEKPADEEINHQGEGVNMKIVMQRPNNRYYRDLDKGDIAESREFFGRQFLIKETPAKKTWKLVAGEQKQILGYTCQKATLQDTSRTVVAWFTPQIPVSIGPGEYAELPGMILEVNIGNGDRTMVASKVDLKKNDEKAIEEPTKGKSVTRKEFDKIVAEKTKEMNAEGGGNGMRVIIRH